MSKLMFFVCFSSNKYEGAGWHCRIGLTEALAVHILLFYGIDAYLTRRGLTSCQATRNPTFGQHAGEKTEE